MRAAYPAFAVYVLLVSLLAAATHGQIGGLPYAGRFALYAVALATLLPGLMQRDAEGVLRVLIWIGAVFCAGIIVAWLAFDGWFYPWQAQGGQRWYRDEFGAVVHRVRSGGTMNSINLVGAIVAVFLVMIAWLPLRGLTKATLFTLAAIALGMTMSRSGALAAAFGLAAVGLLLIMRMRYPRPSTVGVLRCGGFMAAFGVIMMVLGMAGHQQALRLDSSTLTADASMRERIWTAQLADIADKPPLEILLGSGLRSAGRNGQGVLISSHNGYIDALSDTGLIGAAALAAIMLGGVAVGAVRILALREEPHDRAAVAMLLAMIVANGANVLWHAPAMIVLTTLALGMLARPRLSGRGRPTKLAVRLRSATPTIQLGEKPTQCTNIQPGPVAGG